MNNTKYTDEKIKEYIKFYGAESFITSLARPEDCQNPKTMLLFNKLKVVLDEIERHLGQV